MTAERVNYSELNTLTTCEQKWVYSYLLRRDEEQRNRDGLHLGTLLHLGAEGWQDGSWAMHGAAVLPLSWVDDIGNDGKPGEPTERFLAEFDDELVAKAQWLLDRYAIVYGLQPPDNWNVLSSEEWMTATFEVVAGRPIELVGRTDGLVEIDGDLWLLERKSYANKQRLAYIGVDPQLMLYGILAEENYGVPITGVIYDGIHTYQWVKPRAPEDSFQRLELMISEQKRETAKRYLHAAVNRRQQLASNVDAALPAVGMVCSWCGFKEQCWAALGDDDLEIGDPEIELIEDPS